MDLEAPLGAALGFLPDSRFPTEIASTNFCRRFDEAAGCGLTAFAIPYGGPAFREVKWEILPVK